MIAQKRTNSSDVKGHTEFKSLPRVLYFIPEFPRLTETFIEREIRKLIEFGNLDIQVYSLKEANGHSSDEIKNITHYKRLNIFELIYALALYSFTRFSNLVSAFNSIKSSDENTSFVSRFILFIKGIGYAYLFDKYKPDFIYVHFFSWPSTIAMVASIVLDKPFGISAHARDIFVDGTLIRNKVKRARFVSVCNGNAWKKCIELSGGEDLDKIHMIFHGVNLKKELAEPPKLKKPDRPVIFVGSRLVEKKGLHYIIEASKILKERGVAHEVHIVGPGPLYNSLSELITASDLKSNVWIHGDGKGLPFSEIVEYFKIADIFAHPSIETEEGDVDGVPTFVIEAALARLPIITTKAGSITDLIDDNTGIFVPQKDSFALATAIEKLIYDPKLRRELGERAYEKARNLFDPDKNVRELETLILNVKQAL